MLNFFKNLFKDNSNQDYKPGTNQYYIEKYKEFDEVIKTYYEAKDHNGKTVKIDGIVTPLKIDNRQLCSVTDDQGQTPHCAAFSICNLCEALIWKRTGKLINLDANQIYAKAKTIDGNKNSDGTTLEAAINAAIQLGGFGEQSKNIKIKSVYNTKNDDIIVYLKTLIHKYDFLHVGFIIKSGIYSCNQHNYIVNFSGINLGGHAMLCCGYLPEGLIIQNSWGTKFGSKGFCIIKWEDVKKYLIYACYIENF